MGQAHDQPERECPGKKNARKQSNGPGPVTIGVCGAGLAPIRVEYRSSRGAAPRDGGNMGFVSQGQINSKTPHSVRGDEPI
jgi:hypothetical protein